MSHCGFWLDSKCLEVLSKLGRKVRELRLAARLFPEKAEQYCRRLAELVRLAVEVEEMREKAELKPFKTCLDCEFRDRCTVWRKLRLEGVTEDAPIKCPYKSPETASAGSAKLKLRLRNPRQSQPWGCGKRSE